MKYGLGDFYNQRLSNREFRDAVDALEQLNEQLSGGVAKHFNLSISRRFLSATSGDIRKLLARMHIALQEVSAAEIRLKHAQEKALDAISKTIFLRKMEEYFAKHMKPEKTFDRDAQLTTMNFAAEETSNFAIVQAILIAALIGATIGGLLTVVAQYLLK